MRPSPGYGEAGLELNEFSVGESQDPADEGAGRLESSQLEHEAGVCAAAQEGDNGAGGGCLVAVAHAFQEPEATEAEVLLMLDTGANDADGVRPLDRDGWAGALRTE